MQFESNPIPFAKFHGNENDFLITWQEPPPHTRSLQEIASRICSRLTGVGADGWYLAWKDSSGSLHGKLFNADGSEPEVSGNGTLCVAAYVLWKGLADGPALTIYTGAGEKTLRLLRQRKKEYTLEICMGFPEIEELSVWLDASAATHSLQATLLNVGNPQCAVFFEGDAEEMSWDWVSIGTELSRHPRFPRGTNVSFTRIIDKHNIETSFVERGVGQTSSSGTGAVGAAVAAVARGVVESPVVVESLGGSLRVVWEGGARGPACAAFLEGTAEVVAEGRYYVDD